MTGWIDLGGRVAAVTGAGAGIGEGIALALAEVGATIVLLDRDVAMAGRVAADIEAKGGRAVPIHCDVSDPASVAAARDRCAQSVGGCDVLVNNAGFQAPGGLADLPLDAWNGLMTVNLTGCFNCAQVFGAAMLARGKGSIIHIASVSGHAPQPFSSAYSVSKAGVLMLSRQLAVEWGPHGVRSNVVSPGLIRTPMTEPTYTAEGVLERREAAVPMRRVGRPGDIGNAVVFLASDRADYVNGGEIVVDGGFTQTIMGTVPRPGFGEEPPT